MIDINTLAKYDVILKKLFIKIPNFFSKVLQNSKVDIVTSKIQLLLILNIIKGTDASKLNIEDESLQILLEKFNSLNLATKKFLSSQELDIFEILINIFSYLYNSVNKSENLLLILNLVAEKTIEFINLQIISNNDFAENFTSDFLNSQDKTLLILEVYSRILICCFNFINNILISKQKNYSLENTVKSFLISNFERLILVLNKLNNILLFKASTISISELIDWLYSLPVNKIPNDIENIIVLMETYTTKLILLTELEDSFLMQKILKTLINFKDKIKQIIFHKTNNKENIK